EGERAFCHLYERLLRQCPGATVRRRWRVLPTRRAQCQRLTKLRRSLRKSPGVCEPKLGFFLSPASAQNMRLLQSLRLPGFTASLVSLLLFSPAKAGAQQEPATDSEFSVQRFDPAPGPRNYFS